MKKIKFFFLYIFTIPHQIVYLVCKNKFTIDEDLNVWLPLRKPFNQQKYVHNHLIGLIWLIINCKEYRNLFYNRVGNLKYFLRYLPEESTLYILTDSKNIGGGLFIQHGFSTIITTAHIGKKCWINQQVTIGYNESRSLGAGNPWIGDNVQIRAGAKVCGPISIGNNSVIGLNSTVVKNIPENSVVVPSPTMYLIKQGNNEKSKI